MLNKIEKLRQASASLDPSAESRKQLTDLVVNYAESFVSGLSEMKAFRPDQGASKLLEQPFEEQAVDLPALLEIFDTAVIHEGINPASGGQIGYIPGGGMYPSALGDFLADITNRYSGISYASPGAAKMEQELVKWMTDLVGFPESAGGDLTSGGSISNLTAIVTARETMGIRARDVESSCIYMTVDAHHCIDKSIRAAGLADCHKRAIPMDEHFRMDVARLEQVILKDKAAGLRPWLIVSSAGTTDTGAVDPTDAIAEIAQKHELWLHVDAAYGGFFVLCPEGREALKGLEQADSVVMDPHKGLFLPYGTGALLVKNREHLRQTYSATAEYMPHLQDNDQAVDMSEVTPELTRPFRGIRVWLPMKMHGVSVFRDYLDEKLDLADWICEKIEEIEELEVVAAPTLSIMAFAVKQNGLTLEKVNLITRDMINKINARQRVCLTGNVIKYPWEWAKDGKTAEDKIDNQNP